MGASDRNYDRAATCPGCRKREGNGPDDLIPGSVRRGPDDGRLLCGHCWADTLPSRSGSGRPRP